MFNFLNIANDYEERVVARYETDDVLVNTCLVTDGRHPYETGVCHPDYNEDKCVVVEAYDTKEDAQKGHDSWVEIMTGEKLPLFLRDCANALITQLLEVVGGEDELVFPRKVGNE